MLRRVPIAWKLLAVFLVPAIATFAAFGLAAHYSASRGLEDELGRRLTGIAAAATREIDADGLALLQPGDEGTRTYRNIRRSLAELEDATGVARIFVFDEQGRSLCDTAETPIGQTYLELSRSTTELRATRAGVPTAAVLFVGRDGKRYKSAFAALAGTRYVVGVDGAAAMYEQLATLRRTLVETGLAGVLLVVVLALVAARLIVRPITALEGAAAKIARGDLDAPIARTSRDEIGTVADTLEHMRVQLRSRDERMQMMLAGIAHEVRNPLGGIQLYAGLLRDEVADRPELVDYVKKVDRELEHLKQIVSDFLEYARRPRPALAPIDAREVCDEIRQLAQPLADARGVTIAIDGGGTVRADAGQLRRALLNLVQNAVQASPRDSVVTLAVDGARITVSDHGSGIPHDALEKIWTPFYTTKQKGTGLGLAFVREIVEDHGGSVTVASSLDGTTFTITL